MAYFFESGHKSQSEANTIMNSLFRETKMRQAFRYSAHTFADKTRFHALQAADLLAWQWCKDTIDFCINNAIMGVEEFDAYAQTEGER
jgi:hypothetical protein